MSVAMKCFVKLVMAHINTIIVRDLALLFRGVEARRIGGPKRSVVRVHNVYFKT